ncbi:nucleoside triphosphate pyrophosphohydrolase [Acetivibrio saccincola]|jgi:predicted house-cleaning noncanonical NTP pyrophosphatase (MazG superfamily)|uniref:Phosphoribosyl-ATP pyrophosphohydrolase n=1 Tax=Acetivibrio saccincola TaxID=1677857 RepID=A0A2S8RAX4_9FIRM|nr:nucleoside triphosphate pyrophosphohydrolase [Acetivibrio saccincola]NLW28134.1 nucleoside triphosphate pyrophosphohydrolase [Acetivibrio saccincola]PQQ66934.1 phosphoribosyl-ATP pyrophosphohydrolase [Acetivibrio saccincola]HOA96940.1 nucleoside triphosphate pyrophosphohydrolase [Acetivibrio saccincola]HQD28695.1 nucleoside triphosphate pyrophosphohydrolase [Acetivibrio saccincola]
MKSIKYNKLIRDRIPEIIEKSGKKAIVETLNESDYINFLKAKLEEELEEFKKSEDIEEIADIIEVLYAIVEFKGMSVKDLEKIRLEKVKKRGAFKKRLLLKEVIEN